MELAIFIYLASLVGKISLVCMLLLTFGTFLYGLYAVVMTVEYSDTVQYKKTFAVLFAFLLSTATLMPSERTMYMMAAGYAGQTVAQKVSNSESVDKVQKIINNKLDEYLEEQTKKVTK